MSNKESSLGWAFFLLIISYFIWDTVWVLPVKYLTVFFHELSHGLMAVATGGSISKIELDLMQGGVCYHTGGIRLLTASAGYLGSLLWGCLFLIFSGKYGKGKIVLESILFIFSLAVILYVRNVEGLAICIGLIIIIHFLLKKIKNDVAINTIGSYIGLSSCFYAIFDIKDDLIDRANVAFTMKSDASVIGEMIGIPTIYVGIIWFIIALIITYKTLDYVLKK